MILPGHKRASKRKRTAADFAGVTAEVAFDELDAMTIAFSDALREGRCKPSGRFSAGTVTQTLNVLSSLAGAWNAELLFVLLVHGPQRFGELRRHLDGVSSRVLTDKLRHLEKEGYLERREVPPNVVYELSEKGLVVARHLHPIVFFLNHLADQADSRRARSLRSRA